ncbi:hypothetical protein NHG33_06685 [Aerococcaceae bacterium NML130460]|nr:hypothetical protein [Aerococcaceae bacterium NML130460]
MKIDAVFQAPTGTVLVISGQLPNNKVGNYLQVGNTVYKVKGSPTNDNQSILIEKTQDIKPGQEINFLKNIE